MNADRISEVYMATHGGPESQRRARKRIHWMCAAVTGKDVLDLGCSQGIASLLLGREGHAVVGVDREQSAIDYAREALAKEEKDVQGRVRFAVAEGNALPFDDQSFDSVLLGEVVEHLLDPVPVLAEARRCMRPDGTLILTTPYGVFPYPDHKEPVYLGPLLDLIEQSLSVEEVLLIGPYLALVARTPGGHRYDPRLALAIAERRLREQDDVVLAQRAAFEARAGAARPEDAAATEARREVAGLRRRIAESHELSERLGKVIERRTAEATARALALVKASAEGASVAAEAEGLRARLAKLEREVQARAVKLAQSEDEVLRLRELERKLRLTVDGHAAVAERMAPRVSERGRAVDGLRPQLRAGEHGPGASTDGAAPAKPAAPALRAAAATPAKPAKPQLSILEATELTKSDASDAAAWRELSKAHERAKAHVAAAEAAMRALDLAPTDRTTLWTAARTLSRLDGDARLGGVVARLGPVDKLDSKRLERLRDYALRAGAVERVLSAGAEARRRGDDDPAWVSAAAIAEWEKGAVSRAAALISPLVAARAPDDSLVAGAQYFLHVGDVDEAWSALTRMASPHRRLMIEAARQLARMARLDDATTAVDEVLMLSPSNEDAHRLRASITSTRAVVEGRWAGPSQGRAIVRERGRVLHVVTHCLPEHATEDSLRTQSVGRAQLTAGLEVHVATQPGSLAGAVAPESIDGVRYHRFADQGAAAPVGLAERLRRNVELFAPLVEALRPAVLHPASDYVNGLVALELGKRYGIPVVYEVRHFAEEQLQTRSGSRRQTDHHAVARALERSCWKNADHLTTLGETMKDHIAVHGVDSAAITVIPHMVEPGLGPMPKDRDLMALLGLPDTSTIVGCVSTFESYEGLSYLLQAVDLLRGRGVDVHCLLAGDGPERPVIQQAVKSFGLEDRVVFTGAAAAGADTRFLALLDVCVFARTNETISHLEIPLAAFEAMALQRAVVVAGTTALLEAIGHGRAGASFDPERPDDLADELEALVTDPRLRETLAQAGREWVFETWDRERGARSYVDVYVGLDAL